MISNRRLLATAFGSLLLASTAVSSALADCSPGFLANIGCELGVIDQQTANGLDAAHAAAGRPLDHAANQAAGAAANWVVPGSGPYVTQGLEFRDQWNRSGGFRPAGSAFPGGMNAPIPNRQMGNICYTQAGAYSGPFNLVGSGCMANTPWGMAQGVVGL